MCLPARPLALHYDVRHELPDRTCSLRGVHVRRRLQLSLGRELHVRQLALVVHRHQRLPRGREHAQDRERLQWLGWPGVRLSELQSRLAHGVCLLTQLRCQHGCELDLPAVRSVPHDAADLRGALQRGLHDLYLRFHPLQLYAGGYSLGMRPRSPFGTRRDRPDRPQHRHRELWSYGSELLDRERRGASVPGRGLYVDVPDRLAQREPASFRPR